MADGNRGLWALRVRLEHLGTRVYPGMFSLAQAHKAMDDDARSSTQNYAMPLDETIVAFMDLVEAVTHYPRVKRAGLEFLGEQPDPALDRVDPYPPVAVAPSARSRFLLCADALS